MSDTDTRGRKTVQADPLDDSIGEYSEGHARVAARVRVARLYAHALLARGLAENFTDLTTLDVVQQFMGRDVIDEIAQVVDRLPGPVQSELDALIISAFDDVTQATLCVGIAVGLLLRPEAFAAPGRAR